MGVGSRGPQPFAQRVVKTAFLRVAIADWPAVRQGIKREFRSSYNALTRTQVPTPVVCWCKRNGEYEHRFMVLTHVGREPLSAITPESIAAEGFASFEEFRRYWVTHRQARGKRFEPGRMVTVYRVRPWSPDDRQTLAEHLFDRLYGEYVEAV